MSSIFLLMRYIVFYCHCMFQKANNSEKLKVEIADYPVIEENGEIRTRNTLHTSGSLDIYFNKKINPSFFTDNGNGISDKLIDNILISVKYDNQMKENLSSRDFVYSHAFTDDDKSLLSIKRPIGQRLADNATYSFLFGDQIYSDDEINFEGYAVRLWMTSDSVPPVLSKVEIYSNNDNDTKIAKLGKLKGLSTNANKSRTLMSQSHVLGCMGKIESFNIVTNKSKLFSP